MSFCDRGAFKEVLRREVLPVGDIEVAVTARGMKEALLTTEDELLAEMEDGTRVGEFIAKTAPLIVLESLGELAAPLPPRTVRGSAGLFPVCREGVFAGVPPVVPLDVLISVLLEREEGLANRETRALTFGLPRPVAKSYPVVAW